MARSHPLSSVNEAEEGQVGRDYWLSAARQAFIQGGIENVKVDRLARVLNVTRGGFYWHFRNREDLLNSLLESWEQTNTTPMIEAVREVPAGDGAGKFDALSRVWIEEKGYSSAYDSAVRDWARTSSEVAKVVRRVDDRRIELIEEIFQESGFSPEESLSRAQLFYYHQVGHYAMGVKESRATRLKNIPVYYKVLTGQDFVSGS